MTAPSMDGALESPARRQEALTLTSTATGALSALRRIRGGVPLDELERQQLLALANTARAAASLLTGADAGVGEPRHLTAASFAVDALAASEDDASPVGALHTLGETLAELANGQAATVDEALLEYMHRLVRSARRRAASAGETIIRG